MLLGDPFCRAMLAAAASAAGTAALKNAMPTLVEINLARTDPKKYADFLRPMLEKFNGKKLDRPGQITLITQEGAAAVEDAIKFLEQAKPLPPLKAVSPGLCSAALDHATDQSNTGATGHDGSDGSSPFDRMNRHGEWQGSAAENIAYGSGDVRDKVVQLIIDDGVPSRGHRANIFNESFSMLGVAEGPHPNFDFVHVQTFAGGFVEKEGVKQKPAPDTKEKEGEAAAAAAKPATTSSTTPEATEGAAPVSAKTAAPAAAPAAAKSGTGGAVDVSTPRAAPATPQVQDAKAAASASAAAKQDAPAAPTTPTPAPKPPADGLASAPKPPPGGRTDVKTTIQTQTSKEGGKTKTVKTTTKTTIVTAADGSSSTSVETFVETTISG